MRVWTNGKTTLCMTLSGLSVYADGRPVEHRVLTPPASLKRGARQKQLVLAVNEARGVVLAGESQGLLFLVDFKSKIPPRQLKLQVLDAAPSSASEFLLSQSIPGKKGEVEHVIAEINKDGTHKVITSLEMPTPKKIKWPAKVWESSGKAPVAAIAPVRLIHNEFGVAIADESLGIVALLRPDSDKFDFALQLPIDMPTEFSATPTAEGVLVRVTKDSKASAICHFAADGKCLGSFRTSEDDTSGQGFPISVTEDKAILASADGLDLIELSLPKLEEQHRSRLELGAEEPVHLAAVDEDKLIASAGDKIWAISKLDDDEGEEIWRATLLPSAQDKSALIPADAEAVKGPPSPQISQPAFGPRTWTAKAGAAANLTLTVSNNGGEAQGVGIEVSGDAVKKGLVKPVHASINAAKIEFKSSGQDKFIADFPTVILEAAVEGASEDAPPVSRAEAELKLELKAVAQGSGLLMIRTLARDKRGAASTSAFGKLFEVTGKK